MDIAKCAEIKKNDTCSACGGDLEHSHFTDFDRGAVLEYQQCPECEPEPQVLEFQLN